MRKLIVFAGLFLCSIAPVFAQITLKADGLARIRYEYTDNNKDAGFTANDEKSYFRFKFSGGLRADYQDYAFAYLKITNESRAYIKNAGKSTDYKLNEFVIDNLYIGAKDFVENVDVKIGRFDLPPAQYGEGFLIGDGTPLDGSRTTYFNAAQVKYRYSEKSSVEFLGIYETRYDNFPIINPNDPRTALNDSDETGLIVYFRIDPQTSWYFEPYYMYKHESYAPGGRLEDDINTFGSFAKFQANDFLTLRAQAAVQVANYDSDIHAAFGGYAFADFTIPKILEPLSAGYVYLSGDNKNTLGAGGWNPLFSRYPQYSELVANLYASERGSAYWTNLQMAKIDLNFKPAKALKCLASYGVLFANNTMNTNPNVLNQAMFGAGKMRGQLAIAKASYTINKYLTAGALFEYFIPGDFYFSGAKNASFARLEIIGKI